MSRGQGARGVGMSGGGSGALDEPMHRWVEPHGDLTACGIRWWNGTRGGTLVTCPACVVQPGPRMTRREPLRAVVRGILRALGHKLGQRIDYATKPANDLGGGGDD